VTILLCFIVFNKTFSSFYKRYFWKYLWLVIRPYELNQSIL